MTKKNAAGQSFYGIMATMTNLLALGALICAVPVAAAKQARIAAHLAGDALVRRRVHHNSCGNHGRALRRLARAFK